MKENEKRSAEDNKNKPLAETNGNKHNLIPDETSWAEDAKEDLEDFIESQGIHIRQ